jgi:hypothetical protein
LDHSIKINGHWTEIKEVYKKVNGHWTRLQYYDFNDNVYLFSPTSSGIDVFAIQGNNSYSGEAFYLSAKLNGTTVVPTWSITSGNQYATIDQTGTVTILSGANNSTITVTATYNNLTDSKQITVTYRSIMFIQGPDTITGTSGNVVALYNNVPVEATWSITSGNQYATISAAGEITIIGSGQITVQVSYTGHTATKNITLVYQEGQSSHTEVDPETGAITETETITETDPETGAITTQETSTTTNQDGTSSETTTETVTNLDGSSTSQSETVNYDENGDVTGSTTNDTTVNADGSSTSSTTNYNANGDPTDKTNTGIDTTGNIDTQNIEYDEQGNQTVTGYGIDTTASEGSGKEITGDGVNTEFVPFDGNGFICHIKFRTVKTEQPNPPLVEDLDDPATSKNWLFNIMSAKAPAPVNGRYPGFDIRWALAKSNYANGTLRLRYAPVNAGNTEYELTPDKNNVYDVTFTYDPQKLYNSHKITITSAIGSVSTQTADKDFADLNLDFTLGYAINSHGEPYRYANVTIYEFSITKLH